MSCNVERKAPSFLLQRAICLSFRVRGCLRYLWRRKTLTRKIGPKRERKSDIAEGLTSPVKDWESYNLAI